MLGEHTMAINFSYRAIPNLILDFNGGLFSKWPPEYTCLNISVSKSLGKKSVYIYIFRTKYYKKDNNKYVKLTFDLNGGHF